MFRIVRAAATAALLAALVMPGAAAAAPTTGDFVSGSGYRLDAEGIRGVQYKVDARISGAGPTGSFTFRHLFIDLTFTGRVTCLMVSGNRASIGAVITRISSDQTDFGVGDVFTVFLADNGDPYRNQPGPDVVGFTDIYLAEDPAYPGCTDPSANEIWTGFEGNINVKDAP